jgi:hypothetical protein
VLLRPDTQFWIIKRNFSRVPPGSEVEICNSNSQLVTFGTFKGAVNLTLKSKTGFVIATSNDIEDLALLIVENEWYADGPEQLLAAIDVLTGEVKCR